MSGLFDTFNIAKRGLNVQQGAINTTSHNIANANTVGYSRQRAVVETTKPFGGMSRFDTSGAGQVGTGAEITTIQRIRDSFIDYQVRSETGTSGYYTSRSETLTKVQNIFAEPSDKGIETLMTKFFNAFQEVSKNPSSQDVKAAAIKQASALADQINYAYNQLEKYTEDTQDVLKTNVTDINSYLDQVNELNKEIRSVSAVGQAPNDLMDKRDNLVDQLSSKFGIKLERDTFETINLSSTEYPNNALVKANPNDNGYNRFSYIKSVDYIKDSSQTDGYAHNSDGTYKGITVEYYPLGNEKSATQSFDIAMPPSGDATKKTAEIEERKDLLDSLKQNRILLADKYGNVTETTDVSVTPSTISPTVLSNVNASTLPYKSIATLNGWETVTEAEYVDVTDPTKGKKITITSSLIDTDVSTIPLTTKTVETFVTDPADATGNTILPALSTKIETIKDAPTAASTLQKMEFVSYKYESGINNVDNNNVKGEVAANQSVQENLKSMMQNLDRLAESLAYSVNAIQSASITSGVGTQGLIDTPIFINNDKYTGTPSTTTDDGITAKNLKINSALVTDPSKLNCKTSSTSGEGDGKRAAAIANLGTLNMKISNIGEDEDLTQMTRQKFLTGVGIDVSTTVSGFTDSTCLSLNGGTDGSTTDSYYKSMINELGVETQEANRKVDNQEVILAKLEDDRSQVSGVSLDEETTNLIQFQHAYQANAKMIATVNELLDVVINGLIK